MNVQGRVLLGHFYLQLRGKQDRLALQAQPGRGRFGEGRSWSQGSRAWNCWSDPFWTPLVYLHPVCPLKIYWPSPRDFGMSLHLTLHLSPSMICGKNPEDDGK